MEDFGGLQSFLNGLGDVVRLKSQVDRGLFEKQVETFSTHWIQYNPRKSGHGRMGLSLTSLDGQMGGAPDLDSLYEFNKINGTQYRENHFRTPTEAFNALTSLHSVLYALPGLGRTHLLRFDRGGFFPPHRDAFSLNERSFRVLVPLSQTGRSQYAFLLNGLKIEFEPWRAYYVNTLKEHSVFAFDSGVTLLVMNVDLSYENVSRLISQIETK